MGVVVRVMWDKPNPKHTCKSTNVTNKIQRLIRNYKDYHNSIMHRTESLCIYTEVYVNFLVKKQNQYINYFHDLQNKILIDRTILFIYYY